MIRLGRFVARAVLAEIQRIADDVAGTRGYPEKSDSDFARTVLARVIGTLEAEVPQAEWNEVDLFRARRPGGGRPVPGVVQNARPGDELMACPWCGEPVAVNAAVQRVSHELPVCPSFHEEMRKLPTFFDAAHMLATRKVSA